MIYNNNFKFKIFLRTLKYQILYAFRRIETIYYHRAVRLRIYSYIFGFTYGLFHITFKFDLLIEAFWIISFLVWYTIEMVKFTERHLQKKLTPAEIEAQKRKVFYKNLIIWSTNFILFISLFVIGLTYWTASSSI